MLSYRHGFHAGNHADVLKHAVVVQLLRYLNKKDKSYWYIDTHAGAGVYSLRDGYAAKTSEFDTGIGRLWNEKNLPEALGDYVDEVRALNDDGELRFYPAPRTSHGDRCASRTACACSKCTRRKSTCCGTISAMQADAR